MSSESYYQIGFVIGAPKRPAANYFFNSSHDWFFKQGDELWNYVMDKVVEDINKEGGEAKKTHNFNRSVNWKKDAKEGKND